MGQLLIERMTPGMVFEHVGIDYAGPVLLKVGCVRKLTVIKAYIGIFVSLYQGSSCGTDIRPHHCGIYCLFTPIHCLSQ